MKMDYDRRLLAGALVALLAGVACGGDDDPGMVDAGGVDAGGVDASGVDASPVTPEHEQVCMQIEAGVGTHDGLDVPGVSGAPRWGIPDTPPATRRVRRSWSTLTDQDKQAVIDAFVALKNITVDSGDPGSARADYTSFCDELGLTPYPRNLYDFYVEAHANAFISMMTQYQGVTRMAHMGPQFLPWHRYLLLRLEADMAEAIGDPDFALPYWDWTDCYDDGDPSTCAPLFERDYLGTPGACDDAQAAVEGYLVDQGFALNIYTDGQPIFHPDSIRCGTRPLLRKVGCLPQVQGPADGAAIAQVFDREVYDSAPYDDCYTEEDVSFRQYLEGFDNDDTEPLCVAAGCKMHGRGHVYVGGDMQFSSANPNDPIFFLHHAQVDRVWAAWQEANLASGDAARMADYGNPGYPDEYRGGLFNFSDVPASDTFDYKALGYEYDTLPTPQ
ncbi:tyrosinase family protein [Haliangium sp.]|uniref:tyrosinase family protein n=1 Tax=Haliangium sp. TaxID=2663208 RepID=UPI003D0C32FE